MPGVFEAQEEQAESGARDDTVGQPAQPAGGPGGGPGVGPVRPAGGMLTSTMATRQMRPPATMLAVGRSPPAIAMPSGSIVETSAATGATTLIGAAAKPA